MCTRLRKSIVLSQNNRTVQGSLSPSLLLGYPKRVLGLTMIFLMQSEKSTKKVLKVISSVKICIDGRMVLWFVVTNERQL